MVVLLENWDPSFCVELFRDYVLPGLASGFVLAAIFWIIGLVVDSLFSIMRP